jgi:hypothetical protein
MAKTRKETHAPQPLTQADAWLTLSQAARALGKHRQTVAHLAVPGGPLVGERRANITFVTRESVERYLAAQSVAAPADAMPAAPHAQRRAAGG